MCESWRLKGWEKVVVGLGMEGMEHWENAVGTGEPNGDQLLCRRVKAHLHKEEK